MGWMVGPLFGGYLASWGGFSAPFYAAALVALVLIPIPLLMPGGETFSSTLPVITLRSYPSRIHQVSCGDIKDGMRVNIHMKNIFARSWRLEVTPCTCF